MKANPSLYLRLAISYDPRDAMTALASPERDLEASSLTPIMTTAPVGSFLKILTNLAEAAAEA
jgi:hypothetical protein